MIFRHFYLDVLGSDLVTLSDACADVVLVISVTPEWTHTPCSPGLTRAEEGGRGLKWLIIGSDGDRGDGRQ